MFLRFGCLQTLHHHVITDANKLEDICSVIAIDFVEQCKFIFFIDDNCVVSLATINCVITNDVGNGVIINTAVDNLSSAVLALKVMESSPASPIMLLAPLPPVITSSPAPPVIVSAFAPPVMVSSNSTVKYLDLSGSSSGDYVIAFTTIDGELFMDCCGDFVITFITTDINCVGSIDVDAVVTFASLNTGIKKAFGSSYVDIDIISVGTTTDDALCERVIDI